MKAKSKLSLSLGILLMSLFVVFSTSCSKDDNEPIQLYYGIYNDKSNPVQDNEVNLIFPVSESGKIQLLVLGGDGNFVVSNSDKTKLSTSINDRIIDITPISIGNAIVTITDKSGSSYVLNVKVDYRTDKFIVLKQDVIVIGKKLSEVQKEEIQQKAILTLPVKVNGGFKLTYNEKGEDSKGKAYIYINNYGGEATEGSFEFKRVKTEVDGVTQMRPVYVITIDGKQREFTIDKYVAQTRMPMKEQIALNEDITEQFKAEYPDVELVYTQQGVKW